ncbi:MAG: hypothetical protein ACOCVB_01995, partial [Bacillota bacterium]
LNSLVYEITQKCTKKMFELIAEIIKECGQNATTGDVEIILSRHLAELNYKSKNINWSIISKVYDLYKSKEDTNVLRGRFVELILYNSIKNKYDEDKSGMRCYLSNGKQKSRLEVDVFGWDKKTGGEFYECKVDINTMGDKAEEYLSNLYGVNVMFGGKNLYAFACFNKERNANRFVEKNLSNKKGFKDLLLIGREELYRIMSEGDKDGSFISC